MRTLTKSEIITTALIFLTVFLVTIYNLNISLRRSRDAQRKSDLGLISETLDKFFAEYGYFPPSEEGKIKMCKGENFDSVLETVKNRSVFDRELFFSGLVPCEWGTDGLIDVLDSSREPYVKTLPSDPKTNEGISYLYLSNTNRYQIFTYLEGEDGETGFNEFVTERNLLCGNKTCSFGKENHAPLEKSIEEYEKELFEKSKSGSRQ